MAYSNSQSKSLILAVFLLSGVSGICQTRAQQNSNREIPKTAPQVKQELASYDGQKVAAVELAGQPNIDEAELRPLISQKEDQPFSESKINQSVAALKSSGKVKDVELELRPEADGVRVMFVLQPAMYFGIYTFPGVAKFGYPRLLQVTEYPPRGAYSPVDLQTANDQLTHFLQQQGYFEAEVHPQLQEDTEHGLVNVNFQVKLNRHAKFGKVFLDGAPESVQPHLQKALGSLWARLRGVAIRTGKSYSFKTIQKATQYLEGKLIGEGYLGNRVEIGGAEYDPATKRADVHFKVSAGERAHVTIQGAHVWSWVRHRELPVYQQVGLDPEVIHEGQQNLLSYFQSKGYFDAKVDVSTQQTQTGENIIYRITKGPKHSVKAVQIAGNHAIADAQLMQYVKVKKGHFPTFLFHGNYSENLMLQSARNIEKAYQAEGFSTVKVTRDVKKSGGNVLAMFKVDEGPRDIVDTLKVQGNETVPVTLLAPKGLKVGDGKPYSSKLLDEDRQQILAQYLRMGYLNATFRATVAKVNKDPHRLAVIYQITEGPKVNINSVVTLGAHHTRESLIAHTIKLRQGQPMREDEMFASEGLLYTLGIFDWAEVDPRRQVTTQTTEDAIVKLHESKRNQLQYGVGFEVINRGGSIPSGTVALPGLPPVGLPSTFRTSQKTFWGPRGTLQYTRLNLRGLGESFTAALLGARLIQRGAISYSDPHFVGGNWESDVTISAERNSENPIFASRIEDAGWQVQRMLNAAGTKRLSLRYGYRHTSLTNLLISQLVLPEDRDIHLSTLAAAYLYDTRDNALDATRGMYETADFDINLRPIGSSVNFARLRGQVAKYKTIGAGIVWANSLRVGMAAPFASSRVPESELFFSGGGSTLRGFPLNGAGEQRNIPVCGNPSDPATCTQIQVPVGGRELFILNSEFRIPIRLMKNLGVATFYDGGNVFRGVGFGGFSQDYSNTVGIGLRYKTPVGPVRVDWGHNLNAPPGLKANQFFVTLGQAF